MTKVLRRLPMLLTGILAVVIAAVAFRVIPDLSQVENWPPYDHKSDFALAIGGNPLVPWAGAFFDALPTAAIGFVLGLALGVLVRKRLTQSLLMSTLCIFAFQNIREWILHPYQWCILSHWFDLHFFIVVWGMFLCAVFVGGWAGAKLRRNIEMKRRSMLQNGQVVTASEIKEAPIREYLEVVDALYGVYLDAIAGFGEFKRRLEEGQEYLAERLRQKGEDVSTAELDTRRFMYGHDGIPDSDSYVFQHTVTQGEIKQRLDKGGGDSIYMGNMLIVNIYQYWEDKYRSEIASALGIDKNELKLDILGDLRNIRRSIIHNRSKAVPDITKTKEVTKFSPSDAIAFSDEEIEYIIKRVKEAVAGLEQQ